jgi:hypothetical protein
LGKAELVTEGMEQGKGGLAVGGAKNSGSLANNGQTEGKGLVTGHWFVDEHGLPDMAEFMKDTALVRNVRVAVVECRFQSLATVVNNEREATFALDARRIKASQQAVPGVGIFAGRQSSSSLRPLSGQTARAMRMATLCLRLTERRRDNWSVRYSPVGVSTFVQMASRSSTGATEATGVASRCFSACNASLIVRNPTELLKQFVTCTCSWRTLNPSVANWPMVVPPSVQKR